MRSCEPSGEVYGTEGLRFESCRARFPTTWLLGDTGRAMSQENVEIVRRGLEAFKRGDLDVMVAEFTPDCEYISTGAIPGAAGVSRGPDGYKRFVSWLRDEFDDARTEIHELIDAGDQVLVSLTTRGRGKQSGAETSWHFWQVWTLQDSKVVRGQGFTSREEALSAVGLRE